MHVARIIYGASRGLIGYRIRSWSDSAPARWSHAGIVIGDEDVGGSIPTHVWHATFSKGFQKIPLHKFLETYETHEIVSYLVEASHTDQWAWCEIRKNMPYAWGTVIGRFFGLRSSERDADQCAEVSETFLRDMRVVGGPRWRAGHHLITPNVSFNNLCGVAR